MKRKENANTCSKTPVKIAIGHDRMTEKMTVFWRKKLTTVKNVQLFYLTN